MGTLSVGGEFALACGEVGEIGEEVLLGLEGFV